MSRLSANNARNMATDEADDNASFQLQALEIRLPGADFDPNAAPTTGEEYLTHMAYERKHTPAIISRRPQSARVPEPCEVSNVKQVCSANILCPEECAEEIRELIENSMRMLPKNDWKLMQVKYFESTRKKVDKIRATFKPNMNSELPESNDSNVWLEFCSQHPPALRTLLSLGQRNLEQLLDFICEWLQWGDKQTRSDEAATANEQAVTFDVSKLKLTTEWLGEWLYAVLACLHLPLEPEVHSNLREIARISIRQRGRLVMPQEAKYAMIYNIFIQLIANVFGQLDFADFI